MSFNGNANSPVGYQMMEGLQPGQNFYMDPYCTKEAYEVSGPKPQLFWQRNPKTVRPSHTGTVQLRAYF